MILWFRGKKNTLNEKQISDPIYLDPLAPGMQIRMLESTDDANTLYRSLNMPELIFQYSRGK